jgi:hypothetical protein
MKVVMISEHLMEKRAFANKNFPVHLCRTTTNQSIILYL